MVKYYVKSLEAGFAVGIICFYVVENIYAECGMAFAPAMTAGVIIGNELDGLRIWTFLLAGSAFMGFGWITAVFAGGALAGFCKYAAGNNVLGKNTILASLGLIAAGIVIMCL